MHSMGEWRLLAVIRRSPQAIVGQKYPFARVIYKYGGSFIKQIVLIKMLNFTKACSCLIFPPLVSSKPKEDEMKKPDTLTTSVGIPIADDQNSITAGTRGPILMQDVALVEKLAHFNRERIPERVVHAKGTGAYGTFTLNKDLSD